VTKVALFHLSAQPLGGRVSYTYYLAQSLKDQGIEPEIFEVKSKNEKTSRVFAGEWTYRNITLRSAIQVAASMPTLITALDKKFSESGLELLLQKAGLVLHKPEKLTRRMIGLLKGCRTSVIAPSQLLADELVRLRIDATFAPYPYPYDALPARQRSLAAVSLGRIERGRGFDFVFRVNQRLRDDGQTHRMIAAWGEENRVYTYKDIASIVPDWRELGYSGTFEPGTGASIAADADVVVDLKEDRSGVLTYPIIEAWAAGAIPLIRPDRFQILKRFESDPDYCTFFQSYPADVEAFAKMLAEREYSQLSEEDRLKILAKHRPSKVIPAYIEALHIE